MLDDEIWPGEENVDRMGFTVRIEVVMRDVDFTLLVQIRARFRQAIVN